ncbi:MAG TPA: MerR family transcriptional regulator [Chryseosolibacter sp.]|nr:MerR family transcriptional regulator [Chryseosolibacter sp.]
MGTYSIKELEQLSGIKAHTIRIWEKRHRLIEPQRTRTNIRFYSDYDLKKIINVSLLNNNGFKISAIAKMQQDELTRLVIELTENHTEAKIFIDRLLTSMIDLDEEQFENEMSKIEQRYGFEAAVTEVIYPFLEKIGILWQTGNITPAHEHFISNLIRQRILVAIASLSKNSRATIRVVLFLPEQELHEIGLLFFHYITRKAGCKTFYLGQSVPHEDLRIICKIHNPHILITALTSVPATAMLNTYMKKLTDDFPQTLIFASGPLLRRASFKFPGNLRFFASAKELKELLSNFS